MVARFQLLALLTSIFMTPAIGWGAAPADTAAEAAVPAVPAVPAADSAGDVTLLEAVVKAKGRDRAAAEEVAKTFVRIAQIQDSKGDAKAAGHTRQRLVDWFETLGLPRDGAPPAQLAAEARLKLLEPQLARELARKLVEGGKLVPDPRKALESWQEAVVGPLKEARTAKTTPLIELLEKVREYKALAPAKLASLRQGRLALALASESTAAAALDTPGQQAAWIESSKVYRDLAAAMLERAWKETDVAGQRDAVAFEIRSELSKLKPAEYPPLDSIQEETMTPQQQEASKLAALAQRAAKPALKVMYMKKALALDPNNAKLKELLRSAETELAKEGGG